MVKSARGYSTRIALAVVLMLAVGIDSPAVAQTPAPVVPRDASGGAGGGGSNNQPRVFPMPSYFQHVGMLHDGDYQKALEGLRHDFSFGLQAAGAHWVDSICYLTMAGECHLKMGRPADALDDYNAALKLYLAFPNWMMGIRFPATIAPQTSTQAVPRGQSARSARTGRFAFTTTLVTDTVLLDPAPSPNGGSSFINAGGSILSDVQEIARCATLALKRRRELLGPMCPHDPLTAALAGLFARRPAGGHPCAKRGSTRSRGSPIWERGKRPTPSHY